MFTSKVLHFIKRLVYHLKLMHRFYCLHRTTHATFVFLSVGKSQRVNRYTVTTVILRPLLPLKRSGSFSSWVLLNEKYCRNGEATEER